MELTAKAAGGDAVDAPVVEKVSVKAKPSAQTQFDGGWQTSAGTYKIFASGGTITAEGNPQPWYPGTYECWGPAVKATWKHGTVSKGTNVGRWDDQLDWGYLQHLEALRCERPFLRREHRDLAGLREAKSPAAWYSEGLALGRNGEKKWPEAIKAFQNCVALDANHKGVVLARAIVLLAERVEKLEEPRTGSARGASRSTRRTRWRTATSAACCSTCARTTTVQRGITGRRSSSAPKGVCVLELESYPRKPEERHPRRRQARGKARPPRPGELRGPPRKTRAKL